MTVAKEIEAIKRQNGVLYPATVVEWAADHPKSSLYQQFTWDDDVAAREYRLWQARKLIAIHIVTPEGDRRMISLSIDRTAGGGYRWIDDVVRHRELREVMLEDALEELQRVEAKYMHLKELARVFEEFHKVKRKASSRRKGKRKCKGEGEGARPSA